MCGIDSPEKDERWNWVTCQNCLKKRQVYEFEQAEFRAFKNTQEVVVEMTIPLADWEEIVTNLKRAQYMHEVIGGMQPTLSMLIVQLRKASIVTRKATNPVESRS